MMGGGGGGRKRGEQTDTNWSPTADVYRITCDPDITCQMVPRRPGGEARFPGRHNKNIRERGLAGWNKANKRFALRIFDPGSNLGIYWIM